MRYSTTISVICELLGFNMLSYTHVLELILLLYIFTCMSYTMPLNSASLLYVQLAAHTHLGYTRSTQHICERRAHSLLWHASPVYPGIHAHFPDATSHVPLPLHSTSCANVKEKAYKTNRMFKSGAYRHMLPIYIFTMHASPLRTWCGVLESPSRKSMLPWDDSVNV